MEMVKKEQHHVEEIEAKSEPTADRIQKIIGSFGKYQLFICLWIYLSKFPVAFHQMAIIFLAPRTTYSCPNSTELCPCPNPEYDKSIFTSTIISEWDLICNQRWLSSFSQTIFQFGTLIGSIVFGMISDRFGRKTPIIYAIILQISIGVAAAYANSYWLFTVLRFIVGLTTGGTMVVGFVIAMEFVGTQHRDIVSALYQVPFTMGNVLLPVFSYFIRDYSMFQLAISVPTIILLAYIWVIPETPRWLIALNKTDEAVAVLEHVARTNKRPTENVRSEVEVFQKAVLADSHKKGTVVDLFRHSNLRKNIIAMSLNWLACSYCFYGVSQYVGQLSGNIFINVASSGAVSMCGALAAIPLMRVLGRRTIFISLNFTCAAILLLIIVLPDGTWSVVCACIGVVTSFMVFVVAYLYCIELFPTVVRNAALGFSSMMARVGSMIAPFVVDTKDVAIWMPPLLFAILPLIAGAATFFLPETKGCELTTTIEEGEAFGKKTNKK